MQALRTKHLPMLHTERPEDISYAHTVTKAMTYILSRSVSTGLSQAGWSIYMSLKQARTEAFPPFKNMFNPIHSY